MSQLAAIVSADPQDRAAFADAVRPRIALLKSQQIESWDCGDVHVVTAAAHGAPLSSATTPAGAGALVMGRWSDDPDNSTSQAERLIEACAAGRGEAVARVTTYGLAAHVEPDGTVWLGADMLGLFPLYYHADERRLIFATAPGLIEAHPDVRCDFSVRGLVGNLLIMHMVGGHTLRQDVRRLTPGHALRWRRGEGAKEIRVNVLTPGDAHVGETFAQHVDRFEAALDRAIRLDVAGEATGLLLSGGLDSRLLASCIRRVIDVPVHGITLGRATDLEMRVAGKVARTLGWPQHAVDVDWSRYADVAQQYVAQQQLGMGFSDMAFAFAGEAAHAAGATRVFTGVMGDTVMGGEHILWGFDPRTQIYTYDTLFKKINRYGFEPEQIRKLVRREALRDSLDAALADLRDTYDNCAGLPFQKVWLFDLYHRNRFHLASLGWKVAAGGWPVLAFAGSEMLHAAANMPADSMLGRRAQIDLLCRRAPDLAALPLDRNSRTQLAPVRYRSGWHRRWDQKVMAPYRNLVRKREDRRGVDSRYYYRVYDINSPGWRAIRAAAEPFRKNAETILDPTTLRQFVPPPEQPIKLAGDGIVDSSRIKTLLGFMLWAGRHL